MLQTSLLLMKSLNKTDPHCLIRSVFFVSKGNLFEVYFTVIIIERIINDKNSGIKSAVLEMLTKTPKCYKTRH